MFNKGNPKDSMIGHQDNSGGISQQTVPSEVVLFNLQSECSKLRIDHDWETAIVLESLQTDLYAHSASVDPQGLGEGV